MTRAPGMAFAALAGGTPPALAPAQDRDWNGWASHPMWGMWGMWSVWGLMMMLLMLVFWGLVIAGLAVGLRWLVSLARDPRRDGAGRSPGRSSRPSSATSPEGGLVLEEPRRLTPGAPSA